MKYLIILAVTLFLTIPITAQEIIKGKYFTYEIASMAYISLNSDTFSSEGKYRGIVYVGGKIAYSERSDYIKKLFCPALMASLSKEQRSMLQKTGLRLSVDFNAQGKILRITFAVRREYKDFFPEEDLYQLHQHLIKIKFDMSEAYVDDRYLDKNGKYDYVNCFFHLYKYPCD